MIRIDMSMPTNCLDCPACNEYLTCAIPINGRKWKAKDVHEFGQGRPEWCPMKEQEAIEPEVDVLNEIDRLYRCPKCHKHFLYRKQKYCDQCGQAVKWNERDRKGSV